MAEAPVPEAVEHPLGVARGQVANTYIVPRRAMAWSSSISMPRMNASFSNG
jgi:hypothetical protein